ncbi:MAG: AAA family ATPase [Oscillospiraceae bacterium]|nr:AAA family ATPase [Oscillospiraceae bacterium]
MKILKMTASFGNLDRKTLELHDGLNILELPNEGGKSTWSAFLLAMFYGLDTRKQLRGGKLPDKEKYRPWSGANMEGTIELEDDSGRRILLERTSDKKAPAMGRFTARDAVTGEVIEELTAQNCSEKLLHIEQSVFRRSAFIGQDAMNVTSDNDLERRLTQLASSGEETVSYTQTQKTLNDWKNHTDRTNTGALQKTQAELEKVESRLRQIGRVKEETLALYGERQELLQKQERLLYIRGCLRASEACRQHQAYLDAQHEADEADKEAELLTGQTAQLPSDEALTALRDRLHDYDAAERRHAEAVPPSPPEKPEPPQGFGQIAPDEAQTKAAETVKTVRELRQTVKTPPLWIAAIALIAVGIGLLFFETIAGAIGLGLGVILAAVWAILQKRNAALNTKNAKQADELLAPFGVQEEDRILTAAALYTQAQTQYQHETAQYEAQQRSYDAETARLAEEREALLGEVRAFASNIYEAEDAERAVSDALKLRTDLQTALERKQMAEKHLAAQQDAEAVEPPEDFTARCSLPEIEHEAEQVQAELDEKNREIHLREGAVNESEQDTLNAQKETLDAKIERLTQRSKALDLALKALEEANDEMQSLFAPVVRPCVAEKFARLTGGRYSDVVIRKSLSMETKSDDSELFHSMLALSGGTVNQLYLALRLAICELALPEGTPLILDDALVYFDDRRLAAALRLLQEEAKKRQILLFTCQSRENNLLPEEAE